MAESTTNSPYVVELNGLVNSEPHTIVMDVREFTASRHREDGRVMSDEELDARSLDVVAYIESTQAARREQATEPHAAYLQEGIKAVKDTVRQLGATIMSKLK